MPPTHLITLIALSLALMTTSACGLGLYELPDPTPESEWASISLDPAEEERQAQRRYIAARQAALELYQALNEEDWESAWAMMSSETQDFLKFGSPNKDGKETLSSGRLVLPDGTPVEFDPVDLFMIKDMRRLEDEHQGSAEAETEGRKELFAHSSDGRVNKVILIYEIGRWRVHRTKAN